MTRTQNKIHFAFFDRMLENNHYYSTDAHLTTLPNDLPTNNIYIKMNINILLIYHISSKGEGKCWFGLSDKIKPYCQGYRHIFCVALKYTEGHS